MDILFTGIDWIAVVVGAVAAYALGAAWYSEVLFGKKWKEGIGTPAVPDRPLVFGMVTQAIGTLLLAWLIGITEAIDSLGFAMLIAVILAAFIQASGFYTGKTKYAIAVEAGFMLAMAGVMILAHGIF